MTERQRKAADAIKQAIARETGRLPDEDYLVVLEEVSGYVDGAILAKQEELEESDEEDGEDD